MRIAEIFRSIQGEGRLTGTQSVFVRTSGCNLRCAYCDTPYASWAPEGEHLTLDEITARVAELACTHVVLTGGEPMLSAELLPLSAWLRRRGKHITVETAGTRYLPVECDLMSISPKLSNSIPLRKRAPRWHQRHQLGRQVPQVLRRLVAEYDYQLKFVIDRPEDCQEVEAFFSEFPEIDRHRAMLMPQGTEPPLLAEKAAWLRPYCASHGLTFCPRRQIEWFGGRRGR